MAFWEPEDLQGALSGTSHSSHGRPRKTVQARHRHAWAVRMPYAGTAGPEGTALSSSPRGPAGERQPLPVRCSASNLRGSWAGSSLGSRNLRGQLGSWTGSAGCLPAPRSTGLSPSASAPRPGQAQPAAGPLNALSGNARVCQDGRFVRGPWQ